MDILGSDLRDLGRFGLPDWVARLAEPPARPVPDWTWTDEQGTRAGRCAGHPDWRLLRAEGIGTALIRPEERSILLHDLAEDADAPLIGQWLTDQVVPRLLSHLGHLVIHAGAVAPEPGRAVLFVAPSGHGKSTLAGFLHRTGWPLLGDDAILLCPEGGRIAARSVYPRLRLRPDSWAHLHPSDPPAPAGPAGKIDVDLAPGANPAADRTGLPVAALFVLASPRDAGACQVQRIAASETCIELLRGSFALDPADARQAGRRLLAAAAVANAVPGFRLSYPRDYDRLAQVRQAIRDTLERVDPA